MINSPTIFMYGPQTAGKTTRLLRIVKRDHGRDILMSGEDRKRVNNGREVCDVTLRVPEEWSQANKHRFMEHVREQLPVKHVLIDGAQFLSKSSVLNIVRSIDQAGVHVPIIFAGCRYYVAVADRPAAEIPTSHFLMKWCDRVVPVKRTCDFCDRLATRLYVSGFKQLTSRKSVAVDPHLVCDYHYRELID